MDRQQVFHSLRQNPNVEVLVVGAGINGIGTFRDLALQGVDVLLVEKSDFCAGASAASSHMAHGGLRYLENAEFRLVKEALTERNRLLINAPHAVKPLPTIIPIYGWLSGLLNAPLKFLNLLDKPSERGALVIKIGLTLYDVFTRSQRVMPTHSFASRTSSLEHFPEINPKIIYTATYYDAYMPSPERICMELILDAEQQSSTARSLNYVSMIGGDRESVQLQDELTGEIVTVRPRLLINAAGPWIDFVNRAARQETRFIGGTKGSHLVVDHPRLYELLDGHEFYFENKDGRICLLLPFEGRVMIGSTDIRVDDPDTAICTDDEIDYMLELVRRNFPTLDVNRSHIVFQFAGVRPLPASTSAVTQQISRDHSIRVVEPHQDLAFPIYSLVGGKWTTFRAFAEQTADKALAFLGRPREVSTREMAFGGGIDFPKDEPARDSWLNRLQSRTGLPLDRLETLFTRYGTRAETIANFLAAGPDEPLKSHPGYSVREIQYITQFEKVEHVDDILLRRSLIAWVGEVNGAVLEEIARVVGGVLGWDQTRIHAEVERASEILQRKHGVKPEVLAAQVLS